MKIVRFALETIYESKWLFGAAVIHAVLSIAGITILTDRLGAILPAAAGGAPDTWMAGYTVGELNVWYHRIGGRGREAYQQLALWDIFPFMPSYTLGIMGLTIYAADRASAFRQRSSLMYWLPLATLLCDLVETITLWYGSVVYPNALNGILVTVASYSTQLKFGLLAFWIVSLLFVALSASRRPIIRSRK